MGDPIAPSSASGALSLPAPSAWRRTGTVLVLFVLALVLRLPELESRPFHTDEANNAFILQELLQGHYQYRLHDHHGPTPFYLWGAVMKPLGVQTVAQMEAWMLRTLPLLCGLALAGSAFLFRRTLHWVGATSGCGLLLLSAPFVYYGGIAIHEMLLVLALAGFLACVIGGWEEGRVAPALGAGLCAAFALGTKETAAPILAIMGLGAWIFLPGSVRAGLRFSLICGAVAVAGMWLLYAQGGARPGRGFDLFHAISQQVARGTGSEHAHPLWTYLDWAFGISPVGIPWSGWLGLILAGLGFWQGRRTPQLRLLAYLVISLLTFFSLLSYKTPWLMLVWLWPLALLAGSGVAWIFTQGRTNGWAVACTVAGLLYWESYIRCQRASVDLGNPLAYSPSSTDLARLSEDLALIAKKHPEAQNVMIQVVARDYWPLPWTLRKFPETGYWSESTPLYPPAISLLGPEIAASLPTPPPDLRSYALRPGVFIFLRQPSP